MKLSIIIPTFNEEDYLPLLLESIKKQTHQNFSSKNLSWQDFKDYEIIVADNNSEDKTVEIAKSYGCKVVEGGLPPKGRNEGAKIAKGDLFLFLDADVILPNGSLKKFLKELQERKLDIASCFVKPITQNFILVILYNIFYNFSILFLEKIRPSAMDFILIKRNLHEKIGGFNELIKFGEDIDYLVRSSKSGKFSLLKSAKILVSLRRFQQDGWLRTFLKYIFAHFHLIFIGKIKSDILKYKFGHYSQNKKN